MTGKRIFINGVVPEIIRLASIGMSERDIAAAVHCGRNSVRKVLSKDTTIKSTNKTIKNSQPRGDEAFALAMGTRLFDEIVFAPSKYHIHFNHRRSGSDGR